MAIITTYLTSLDLRYYAQKLGCAVGDLGYKTANDFYYGKKCAASNLRKLKLAQGYLSIIERYIALTPDNINDPNINCISEEQLQNIIVPAIKQILNVPLPLPGSIINTTNPPITLGNLRIITDGSKRITTDGSYRQVTL